MSLMTQKVQTDPMSMNGVWKNTIALLVTFILGSCEAVGQPIGKDMVIYYKPFNIATLLPVTAENIEQQANCVFRVEPSDPVFQRIVAILNSAQLGTFNSWQVRVKIVLDDVDVTLIDRNGGILASPQIEEQTLGTDEFVQLKSVL